MKDTVPSLMDRISTATQEQYQCNSNNDRIDKAEKTVTSKQVTKKERENESNRQLDKTYQKQEKNNKEQLQKTTIKVNTKVLKTKTPILYLIQFSLQCFVVECWTKKEKE